MQNVLTPSTAKQLAGKLAPLGKFERLQFVTQQDAQGYHRFFYRGIFTKGTQPFLFVLDQSGKIAGLFLA